METGKAHGALIAFYTLSCERAQKLEDIEEANGDGDVCYETDFSRQRA